MSVKYAFIAGEEGNYPVRKMVVWAKVSRSGYYEWKTRIPCSTARWRAVLICGVHGIDDTGGRREH